MDFKFNTDDPEFIKGLSYIKNREKSILEFQLRVFDLVFLDSTPIMEKINFIAIVINNLKEFISLRLPEKRDSEELSHLIFVIEAIFDNIGKAIRALNREYEINPIYFDIELSERVFHKDFRYIYSGENDFQLGFEMNETTDVKENSGAYTMLYTGGETPPDRKKAFIIKVPMEIILIDDYKKKYQEKYSDECFHTKIVYDPIPDYYTYLQKEDMVIRNPYDSYKYITDFIDQMCNHPEITAIFITLYRTAKDSKIVESLIKACELGKRVFVYVETSARGDEVNNIRNVYKLRKAGAWVNTNYFNYKVHSKLFLAVDRHGNKFVHIGTGNYNEKTAKCYTDSHILTTRSEITNEIVDITVNLFRKKPYFESHRKSEIYSAPMNFRSTVLRMMNREIKKGQNGRIWIKCNNLCDCNVISKLYMAAKAGVDVKIICRTGCSIAPVKNLEVRSKAGQYLEHDRIYIFGNKAYISSADLLFRNISKRLEILCEIPLKKADRIFDGIWNSQGIHKLTNNGKWELM